MRAKVVIIAFIFLFAGNLCAQSSYPQYTGYINDFSNVLSSQDKVKLQNLLYELEQKTTAQVAVVSIDTVRPLDIETYAVELFERWGIGQKGKDNGVLFLVALKDRELRIETGYGLEGAIPDALAKEIISQVIVPSFKSGNYSKGIMDGTLAVTKLVAGEYNVELTGFERELAGVVIPAKPGALESLLRLLLSFIFFVLIFGLRSGFLWWFILAPGTRHRRGGYWYGSGYGGSSGGFGGGFGGFGGGMSGGGGASGSW